MEGCQAGGKIFFIKFRSFYTRMAKKVDRESLLIMFSKLNDTPGYYMMQAVQKWDREIDSILDGLGTTRTQLVLLTALVKLLKDGEPVTQKQVADFVRRDQNTVSAVMRTLEKKGQITRSSTEDDMRAKYIVLTDKGLSLVEQATEKILLMNQRLFPDVNDNKELIKLSSKYL
jgi:DNA-binding MarR family transcriptional regulator